MLSDGIIKRNWRGKYALIHKFEQDGDQYDEGISYAEAVRARMIRGCARIVSSFLPCGREADIS